MVAGGVLNYRVVSSLWACNPFRQDQLAAEETKQPVLDVGTVVVSEPLYIGH